MSEPELTVNEHEFRVFAMKRSGHHAVMNWLIGHFDGPIYFLNNCSFSQSVEFSSTRVGRLRTEALFSGRVSVFGDGHRITRIVEHLRKDELVDRPRERLQALVQGEQACLAQERPVAERDAYLWNLEDFHLESAGKIPWFASQRGRSRQIHNLIVIRDPYNWLASRRKGSFPIDAEVLEAWKSQAREALRETTNLPNCLIVNYNLWFASADYRADLSRRFGREPSERGVDYIADFGGGSSFEGFTFQNRATEMHVLERWKVFAHDAEYWSLFADPELVRLSRELFDMAPAPPELNAAAPQRKPASVPQA